MSDGKIRTLLYDRTFTANASTTASIIVPFISAANMSPPYLLEVQTDNAGATAPSGNLSFNVQVQHTTPEDTAGADWTSITNFTLDSAITAAGTKTAFEDYSTNQIGTKVRAIATVAADTWNNGTRVRAWLVANRG